MGVARLNSFAAAIMPGKKLITKEHYTCLYSDWSKIILTFSNDITSHDTTKNIDKDGIDFWIRGDDFKGFFDLTCSGSTTNIWKNSCLAFSQLFVYIRNCLPKKLAGLPPWSWMMSIVAMAKPAPLTMQPMSPSKAM